MLIEEVADCLDTGAEDLRGMSDGVLALTDKPVEEVDISVVGVRTGEYESAQEADGRMPTDRFRCGCFGRRGRPCFDVESPGHCGGPQCGKADAFRAEVGVVDAWMAWGGFEWVVR
ncbi:hypothetical protein AB0D98_09250 [Streptomyces sp. NPDC047987]|uniref:hypothetical protein n=1 Tax=unclassified Streptomyces TaxID=2593676 RepID=UPI0034235CA1